MIRGTCLGEVLGTEFHWGNLAVGNQLFNRFSSSLLGGADMVAVVVDAWNKYTRVCLDDNILNILKGCPNIPSVLILNKVDKVKKSELIPLANNLMKSKTVDPKGLPIGGWDGFDQVHYVSAAYGLGIELLLRYFEENAMVAPWEFGSDVYSDASYEEMISEVLREKLLTMIGEEIPWQVCQMLFGRFLTVNYYYFTCPRLISTSSVKFTFTYFKGPNFRG